MIDIEPKGFHRYKPKKREIPKELKPVEEKYKKPPPKFKMGWLDPLNNWIKEVGSEIATKAVKDAIPSWVWITLIGVVVIAITILLIVIF